MSLALGHPLTLSLRLIYASVIPQLWSSIFHFQSFIVSIFAFAFQNDQRMFTSFSLWEIPSHSIKYLSSASYLELAIQLSGLLFSISNEHLMEIFSFEELLNQLDSPKIVLFHHRECLNCMLQKVIDSHSVLSYLCQSSISFRRLLLEEVRKKELSLIQLHQNLLQFHLESLIRFG